MINQNFAAHKVEPQFLQVHDHATFCHIFALFRSKQECRMHTNSALVNQFTTLHFRTVWLGSLG